jgi:hypothetical protein
MNKIKANNYQQAFKEIEAIDKEVAKALPQEINENDRGHYVVALVKQQDNPVKKKYDVTINIQQYDDRGFAKAEKGLAFLGFDKMVILHNPEQVTATVQTPAPATPATPTETAEQIEARLKKEFEEKYAGYVPAPVTPAPAPASEDTTATGTANTGTETTPKTVDLKEYTVAQLEAFAKDNEIDIKGLTKKDDIFNALTAWQEDKQ